MSEADDSPQYRIEVRGWLEADWSEWFEGMAVQTMRSGTYLQPGQTSTCIGCHEHRGTAPPTVAPVAAGRAPSKLTPRTPGTNLDVVI